MASGVASAQITDSDYEDFRARDERLDLRDEKNEREKTMRRRNLAETRRRLFEIDSMVLNWICRQPFETAFIRVKLSSSDDRELEILAAQASRIDRNALCKVMPAWMEGGSSRRGPSRRGERHSWRWRSRVRHCSLAKNRSMRPTSSSSAAPFILSRAPMQTSDLRIPICLSTR